MIIGPQFVVSTFNCSCCITLINFKDHLSKLLLFCFLTKHNSSTVYLTKSLIHHGFFSLIFFIVFINKRGMREPRRNKKRQWSLICRDSFFRLWVQLQLCTVSDLWLLAEGRSSTMITSRIVENRRRQKASSTHKSRQLWKEQKQESSWAFSPLNIINRMFRKICNNKSVNPEDKKTLTLWQSTSLKTLVVQMINMIEAENTK